MASAALEASARRSSAAMPRRGTDARPAARVREYILALRAIFDAFAKRAPLRFEGEFYNFSLLSDFFDPEWEAGLKSLLHHRFQVTAIHVLDRTEVRPDFVGDLKLVDCETGDTKEVTVSKALLEAYEREHEKY